MMRRSLVLALAVSLAASFSLPADARRSRRSRKSKRSKKRDRSKKAKKAKGPKGAKKAGEAKPAKRQDAKKVAKKYFAKGKKLFARKRFKEAIVEFKKAYELWSHRIIKYNIALAYALKGDRILAAVAIREYLSGGRGHGRKLPNLLQTILFETGVLAVETPDPEAVIYVDGQERGKGMVKVVVQAGKRAVHVRVGSKVLARRMMMIPGNGERLWEITSLAPREAPRRTTPVAPRVAVAIPRVIVLPRRESDDEGKKLLPVGYFATLASVTVAALASATGLQIETEAKLKEFNRAKAEGRPAAEANEIRDKGITFNNAALAMWALGGAALTATIVLGIYTRWSSKEKEKPKAQITPTLSPGGVGVQLRWRWP